MATNSWFKKILKSEYVKKLVTPTNTFKATDELTKLLSRVTVWFKGKNIAIIGATACGKNAMFDILKGENLSEEHTSTRGVQKINNFKIRYSLPDKTFLNINLKQCKNVGGEEDQREQNWKIACMNADVIFYLIDINKLLEDSKNQKERIKYDLKWLSENISSFQKHAVIHIFLNKVDLLLNNIEIENRQFFLKKELEPHIEELEKYSKAILGSYKDRITGISPISMKDKSIFNLSFTQAIVDIKENGTNL